MPSTIPYDPSLVLGNIVSVERLQSLDQIAAAQSPADSAEDTLNTLIALKRSLDMTIQELINMGVDPSDVIKSSEDTGKRISSAASEYAKAKVTAALAVQPIKAKIKGINESLESPVDYNRTEIKQMPLSSDSLQMNVQYFSNDSNKQNSSTHASTISSFISDQVSIFGDDIASQTSGSAASQVNSQLANHDIEGTLVISITCTHKNAIVLAPFIIDVDKAIRIWNRIFTDQMIKTDSESVVEQIAAQSNTGEEKYLSLLSGATYGSCFIGMVHVLNTSSTESDEVMRSIAAKLQTQSKISGWFEDTQGGFGVDSNFSQDAKNLLSIQNITSHCSLVTMGSIPSIKSNQVAMAVKGFTDDDGAKSIAALLKLQNVTATEQDSVDASANAARTGAQFVALQSTKVQAALSGLADIDNNQNKIIDTNSIMDALDDYIQKALAGNIGIPINFYLKPITRSQLAQMWMSKYYPSKFMSIAGDDSGQAGSSTTTNSVPPADVASAGSSTAPVETPQSTDADGSQSDSSQ